MPALAKTTSGARKGSGKRRHYRGKMTLPDGSPRSHTHGGHSQATGGWTCNDTLIKELPTKAPGLGRFRVTAPTKRIHRKGPYGSIS